MIRNKISLSLSAVLQETARNYLTKSCEKGHSASFFYLGMIHELGIGGPVDKDKATEAYNKALERNDPQAIFKLAMIAQSQNDPEKHYLLMKQAAELGLLEAQHNLGCFYLEKQEINKAVAWFLNAGKLDFYPSMINLGSIFLTGKGKILSNPLTAYSWLKRAQSIENSPELQALMKRTLEEINNISKQYGA